MDKKITVSEKEYRAKTRKLERHENKLRKIKKVAQPFVKELNNSLRYIK